MKSPLENISESKKQSSAGRNRLHADDCQNAYCFLQRTVPIRGHLISRFDRQTTCGSCTVAETVLGEDRDSDKAPNEADVEDNGRKSEDHHPAQETCQDNCDEGVESGCACKSFHCPDERGYRAILSGKDGEKVRKDAQYDNRSKELKSTDERRQHAQDNSTASHGVRSRLGPSKKSELRDMTGAKQEVNKDTEKEKQGAG